MAADANDLLRTLAEAYRTAISRLQDLQAASDRRMRALHHRTRLQLRKVLLQIEMDADAIAAEESINSLVQQLQNSLNRQDKEHRKLSDEIDALKAELTQLAAQIPAKRACPPYTAEQAVLLKMGLFLAPLGYDGELTPPIDPVGSGKSGASRLFVLPIPGQKRYRFLAAKFDDPDRAEREWDQLERLRKLNLPPEIILPLPSNYRGDGYVLSHAATGPDEGACGTVTSYFQRCLGLAQRNCRAALDLALRLLPALYQHEPGLYGDHIPQGKSWASFDLVQESTRATAERKQALRCLEQIKSRIPWDFLRDETVPDPRSDHTCLPNPLLESTRKQRADQPIRRMLLCRIHNDLNLDNLLVDLDGDRSPQAVYVIDLARSRDWHPAALDYARLEVELILEAFALKRFPRLKFTDPASQVLDLLDYLDGRIPVLPADPSLAALADLLVHLRRRAYRQLIPPGESTRLMEEYFSSLYFTYLWHLEYLDHLKDLDSMRIAVLGAASALLGLQEMYDSRYSPGADCPRQRPWEDAPVDSGVQVPLPWSPGPGPRTEQGE